MGILLPGALYLQQILSRCVCVGKDRDAPTIMHEWLLSNNV